MMHHCSFYWSSVKSFLANCFLIIGDHFRLDFYNICQCQLTISWVAMVTCGPIVFPKVLWMQHLRIIFDFNALDMMQIFKSIPMVVNWYKTEIAQYFYKWCFFYIYYQTENMNRKGIMWVKASEGTAMPCGFTRHPQHGMGKSPSKCYNVSHWLGANLDSALNYIPQNNGYSKVPMAVRIYTSCSVNRSSFLLYPLNNEVVGGYIGFSPSGRPSVCPACRVRSVTSTVLDRFFPY